jgi:predicted dehydrogenase
MRKAAIIGIGSVSKAHMQALASVPDRVRLTAVVDPDGSRLNSFRASYEGEIAVYTRVAEMLEREQPDIVHICSPSSVHAQQTIDSLEAGAHVFCEKPLCRSLADVDNIAQVERRMNRRVCMVAQMRFGSGGQHYKRLIDQGVFGRALVVLCTTMWYRDQVYYDVGDRGRWSGEGGGTTLIHAIHELDLALWLLGGWQTVQAQMRTFARRIEVEDVLNALVTLQNGALMSVVNSVLSPKEETRLRIDFERATLDLRHVYGYSNSDWHLTPASGFTLPADNSIPDTIPTLQATQYAAFLDSLDRGAPAPVTIDDSRRILEFITALYKSALTHQPVEVNSITPDDPFYYAMNGQMA